MHYTSNHCGRVELPHRMQLAALIAGSLLAAGAAVAAPDVDEWAVTALSEPSGVVYHAGRRSLFVVGDEGDIGEVSLTGEVLRHAHLGGDLEGVACDPSSGLLYVVREGHEIIYEVRPDDFEIVRRFSIDRTFDGDANYLKRGGDGVEGLTFVPDPDDAEGGRFFAVNQYDPAVLLELHLPLRSSKERFETATIVAARAVSSAPLSDVAWDDAARSFVVVSALWRKAYVTDRESKLLRTVRVPGLMPEGLAVLPDGRYVIAQDTGGLLLWHPSSNPFAAPEAVVQGTQEHGR